MHPKILFTSRPISQQVDTPDILAKFVSHAAFLGSKFDRLQNMRPKGG